MIKNKVILLFVIVFLIISSPVKAELEINIPENITLSPGELKIIKINIKNLSTSKRTINPDLDLPSNWKLIIPLNSVTIGPNGTKNINILVQPSKMIRSAIYPLSLMVKTAEKMYRMKIRVKIKKIYKTEVKVVKAPRCIEEKFEIKLKLINKGNTFRRFKIVDNKTVAIDKTNILLDPFESKIITVKCRVKEYESEEVVLNLRAEDEFEKNITLFNDKISILKPDNNFKNYESRLNSMLVREGKEYKQYWQLKTSLNDKSFLEVSNNYFNYYQKNKNKRWQFGTEYLDQIKLNELSKKNNIIKISYEFSPNGKFNNIVYTDFINEIGFGFLKYLERHFYYLEFKNNKDGKIDYYFNTSIRKEKLQFNYKRTKLNGDKQVNSFFKYEVTNDNNLKVGFNKVNINNIPNKKYFRYSHQKMNKRITFNYTVLKGKNTSTTMGLSRKDINIIGEYFLYSSLKFKKIKDKWSPELKLILKNNKNKFLIKKNHKNGYGLEFERIIKNKNGKLQVSINNYGSTKFNINTKKEFTFKENEFYFMGNFSYDTNNSFQIKNFKLGISLPFTVKLEKKDKNAVIGKIRGIPKNLGGIVLDINGQKVKTKANGSFIAYIDSAKGISIKAVDLGKYTGKYFLKPNMPYLIKNYSGEKVFLDMVEYGYLKLIFKNNDYKSNTYLDAIGNNNKKKGNIILYNEELTFIKKFKGDKEISFNNIPPGQYNLKMDNKGVKHNYELKNMSIEISPGDNQILIKNLPLKKPGLKIKEEAGKIIINN